MHLEDVEVANQGASNFVETAKQISNVIEKIKPDVVLSTHYSNLRPFDHIASFELAKEAMQQVESKPKFWLYWVWTWYHLKPSNPHKLNFRSLFKVNIQNELKVKQELMDMYLEPQSPNGNP